MANTIRIKRSVSTNTPPSLAQGELAFSEDGSPNGIGELFIGVAGPGVQKIATLPSGAAAEPNDSGQDNQTITTALGIDGADAGSSGNISISLGTTELTNVAPVAADQIVFNDDTDSLPKKQVISSIPLSIFDDDLGYGMGTVTSVVGGVGIDSTGGADPSISLNLSELTVASMAAADWIAYDDAGSTRKALISGINLGLFNNDQNWIPASGGIFTGNVTLDGPVTTADYGTGGRVKDGTDVSRPVGFNVLPVYEIDVADTFDLAHNGMLWHKDSGGAISFTANNDADIPQGATYVIHNDDAEALTLAEGTADIYWLEGGSAPLQGDVTIDQGGVVSLYKYSDTEFWAWGSKASGSGGSVTSVGTGTGLSGGPITGTGTIDLDFDNIAEKSGALVGTDRLVGVSGTTHFDETISGISLGIFDNATSEFVSENDTPPAGFSDWNWVIDEDLMGSNSNIHVPTQQSVKAYVDTAVTGAMTHKGGYNAATNTPALDTGSPVLAVGDLYTCTVAGTFFTVALEVGDTLISDVDSSDAAQIGDWTIVQTNIGAASETVPGYIEIANTTEADGGSDNARAITSAKLHATTFDGGTF